MLNESDKCGFGVAVQLLVRPGISTLIIHSIVGLESHFLFRENNRNWSADR